MLTRTGVFLNRFFLSKGENVFDSPIYSTVECFGVILDAIVCSLSHVHSGLLMFEWLAACMFMSDVTFWLSFVIMLQINFFKYCKNLSNVLSCKTILCVYMRQLLFVLLHLMCSMFFYLVSLFPIPAKPTVHSLDFYCPSCLAFFSLTSLSFR